MLASEDNAWQAVRRRHELRVLETLVVHGNRTRRQLEADTKLSRTTLSAIVGELRQRGVLMEDEQLLHTTGRHGRPNMREGKRWPAFKADALLRGADTTVDSLGDCCWAFVGHAAL